MITENEQYYAFWLACVEGLGNRTKIQLVRYAGSPKAVYEMKEKELEGLVTKNKLQKILQAQRKEGLKEAYKELGKMNIQFFSITHPQYPQRLARIDDAPYGIYVEGSLPEEGRPAVAVIGARQCTEYGRLMAKMCGRELAKEGVDVISGMARGIDGICQSAVLDYGGKTYSVLGCGTNVCYPEENRNIYVRIKKSGGILSEYVPGTQPRPQLFPPRNRIISGLADVVLIVEARVKSGTLITADMALEQGKEVYVVPGRVTDLLSEGCIRLSRQGAGIMTSVREMLEETGLTDCRNAVPGYCGYLNRGQGVKREEMEMRVLEALDYYPAGIELLLHKTGLEYQELISILIRLCMEGMAEQVSASQYIRK